MREGLIRLSHLVRVFLLLERPTSKSRGVQDLVGELFVRLREYLRSTNVGRVWYTAGGTTVDFAIAVPNRC